MTGIVALAGVLALVQPGCSPADEERLRDAARHAAELDLGRAAAVLAASDPSCERAGVARLYLDGLHRARLAFSEGGSPESLAPVLAAITGLGERSRGLPGPAEIARLTLWAAAAAAQSERDEMRVYLDAALQMETLQQVAGLPGAPLVGAAEIAGDLWLQVHRYDEAGRAYAAAAERAGPTLRTLAGRARVLARLGERDAGCTAARTLLDAWGRRPETPPEIADVRTFLETCSRP